MSVAFGRLRDFSEIKLPTLSSNPTDAEKAEFCKTVLEQGDAVASQILHDEIHKLRERRGRIPVEKRDPKHDDLLAMEEDQLRNTVETMAATYFAEQTLGMQLRESVFGGFDEVLDIKSLTYKNQADFAHILDVRALYPKQYGEGAYEAGLRTKIRGRIIGSRMLSDNTCLPFRVMKSDKKSKGPADARYYPDMTIEVDDKTVDDAQRVHRMVYEALRKTKLKHCPSKKGEKVEDIPPADAHVVIDKANHSPWIHVGSPMDKAERKAHELKKECVSRERKFLDREYFREKTKGELMKQENEAKRKEAEKNASDEEKKHIALEATAEKKKEKPSRFPNELRLKLSTMTARRMKDDDPRKAIVQNTLDNVKNFFRPPTEQHTTPFVPEPLNPILVQEGYAPGFKSGGPTISLASLRAGDVVDVYCSVYYQQRLTDGKLPYVFEAKFTPQRIVRILKAKPRAAFKPTANINTDMYAKKLAAEPLPSFADWDNADEDGDTTMGGTGTGMGMGVVVMQPGKQKEKADEEAKKKAAEEAKRVEEAKKKAAEEAKRVEEEKKKVEEEAKRVEEEKKKAEQEAKRVEEEKKRVEEEAKQKAAEEAKRVEEEKKRVEEETKKKAEEEAKKKKAAEAKSKAEEEAKRKKAAEEEKKKKSAAALPAPAKKDEERKKPAAGDKDKKQDKALPVAAKKALPAAEEKKVAPVDEKKKKKEDEEKKKKEAAASAAAAAAEEKKKKEAEEKKKKDAVSSLEEKKKKDAQQKKRVGEELEAPPAKRSKNQDQTKALESMETEDAVAEAIAEAAPELADGPVEEGEGDVPAEDAEPEVDLEPDVSAEPDAVDGAESVQVEAAAEVEVEPEAGAEAEADAEAEVDATLDE
jgi:hypothetical protein